MNKYPTRAEFAAHVRTGFRLNLTHAPGLELELIEVKELCLTPRLEAFSLLFRGPRSVSLGQDSYQLSHERLGALELMLVPVGVEEEGSYYEAIFNLLLEV
jgi:hypothetical protein